MGGFGTISGLSQFGSDLGNAGIENQQYQLAKQKIQSELALQQAQTADVASQSEMRRAQTRNLTNTVPVTMPSGETYNVPLSLAGAVLRPTLGYQGKIGAANIGAGVNLRKLGLQTNPETGVVEPVPQEQLSPYEKSRAGALDALEQLRQAQTDLAQAKNDPNSPLFKQAQQRVAIFGQLAAAKFGELGLGKQKLDAEYAFHGLTPDGQQSANAGGAAGGGISPEKFAVLSPHAQQIIMEAEPAKQQIGDLIKRIEDLGLEKDNTSAKLAIPRLQYKFGQASPEGSLGEDISKLELQRVVSAARLLRGSSRSFQALQQAMLHAPNTYIDSPMLMYQKLKTIQQNLQDMQDDAQKYGNKFGITPSPMTGGSRDAKVLDAPTAASYLQKAGGDKVKARALAQGDGYKF